MTTENADIEIQDELDEIINEGEGTGSGEESGAGENEGEENKGGEGDAGEAGEGEGEGGEKAPEIDKKHPSYDAGRKNMQEAMQIGFDKKINKLVGQNKQAGIAMQAEFTKKIEELKTALTPKAVAPLLKDFETEEEYVEAAVKHTMAQNIKPAAKEPSANGQPAAAPTTPEELQYRALEAEYAKTHPNYYANMRQLEPFMNNELFDCIFDTSPDVAEWLSQNLNIVQQISGLLPTKMGKAIGAIEAAMKKSKPGSNRGKKKPAPVTESNGGNDTKDIITGSQNDYNKQRAKMDGYIK